MGGYVAWWSNNRLHIQRLCGLRVTELQQSKASNLKVILLLGRVHFQFVLIREKKMSSAFSPAEMSLNVFFVLFKASGALAGFGCGGV